MKALSIHPVPAMYIAEGIKRIEVRTWETNYRGDLLICSTAKKARGTIPSHALCVAQLSDIVPLEYKHLDYAMMDKRHFHKDDNLQAWILDDIRIIKPIPIKGKLGLWNYDGEIEYIPREEWQFPLDMPEEEFLKRSEEFTKKYWADITI